MSSVVYPKIFCLSSKVSGSLFGRSAGVGSESNGITLSFSQVA